MTRLFVYCLSICFFWMSVHTSAIAGINAQTYLAPVDVRQKALLYSTAFQSLATNVESKLYSVDGVTEALDYDVDAAVSYVENEISYDPYLGVMRGQEGTISTQAGSTWDQAVLLAGLINAMGGEAMLALGKLTQKESVALLARGVSSRQIPIDMVSSLDADVYFKEHMGAELAGANSVIDASENISYEKYSKAADNITDGLVTQLKAGGQPLAEPSLVGAIDYAKRLGNEYVWVRYRDTPNDPWADAHPVYAGDVPPDVTPEKYISAKVPDQQLHKIGIQFHIETRVDGVYKRTPVSQVYEKPAANLSKAQLRIGISPNTVGLDEEPAFYTPVIGDVFAPGAKSFTMMGQTVSPEDAAAGPAIFTTVANKLGRSIDVISDGEKNKLPTLTGVILTISHSAPGGEKIHEERRLTDFREGRPDDYHLEMFARGVLEVDVGAENGARNMVDFLQSSSVYIRQVPYLQAVIDGGLTLEDMHSHPAFAKAPSHSWLQALALGNSMAPRATEGRVVRTSPLVMFKRDVIRADDRSVKFAIDIQHNRVRGFSINPDAQVIENPALALKQGVMDTLLEGELIGLSKIARWKTEDQLRLVSTPQKLKADPVWSSLKPITQDRMLADLNQSGHLLIPNKQNAHWWRVDNTTGNLLGMGTLGGTEATEHIALQGIAMAVTLGFMAYGLISGQQSCMGAGKSQNYKNCCLMGVVALNVGLVAAGGLVGIYRTFWSTIYSLSFDFAVGLPTSPIVDGIGAPQVYICNWVYE